MIMRAKGITVTKYRIRKENVSTILSLIVVETDKNDAFYWVIFMKCPALKINRFVVYRVTYDSPISLL